MGAAGSVLEEKEDVIRAVPSPGKKRQPGESAASGPHSSYTVALGFWPGRTIELPDLFKLRVSYESLDFLRSEDDSPLIQFPFQNIICWGSSRQNFQFKVFDFENTELDTKKDNGILISLKTTQGRLIEDSTMSMVQKLMVDINQRAISKQEFQALQNTIFDENQQLREGCDWLQTIDQFTTGGRLFLAKQGMELLIKIGDLAPFEKFDLACLLYERIINKNSFQLLVNTFQDEQDRDNLIHRLKLNKEGVVKNCAILPEKAELRKRSNSMSLNSNSNSRSYTNNNTPTNNNNNNSSSGVDNNNNNNNNDNNGIANERQDNGDGDGDLEIKTARTMSPPSRNFAASLDTAAVERERPKQLASANT
mmetsp:Transcript_13453/g.22524  ORF Transcript_13453/g.22524 Transcript_13453/m.22524 type:complete len:365 (-) Transcript_13453:529-1623(-)